MSETTSNIFGKIGYPFRLAGRGIAFVLVAIGKFFKRLFTPGANGRTRWAVVGILLLGVIAGLVDYTKPWDGLAQAVNSKTQNISYLKWIKLPNYPQVPVKLGLDLKGGAHLLYEADMSAIPQADRADALAGVRDVIERRVNAFGVSEPVIQTNRVGDHYRVIVELAGITDVNQAIKMIGETPTLDFREQDGTVADAATSQPTVEYTSYSKEAQDYNAAAKKKAEDLLKQIQKGADFTALAKQNSEDPGSKDKGGDLDYFAKGEMVKPFEDAVWNLRVGQIAPTVVQTDFGYHIIKKTGQKTVDGKLEVRASHILIATKPADADPVVNYQGWKMTELSGKQLKTARVIFDQQTGQPQVQLTFNSDGDKMFADITGRNVGKRVGIFLDGEPISVPTVEQKISGGTAVIQGNFSLSEAKLLAQRLNAGALPVPISLVSQQAVDATLGSSSLQRSLEAGLIGFAVVVLFMLIFYRLPGLLASVALLVYSGVTLAIFKLVGITMSLAGIAGFILSIGMAVDANILIFERVKEELRRGRTLSDGLHEGFKRAWNSIRDSNMSSLITCAILIWFGASTVRGFAITLAIGILVSMFSAITITRTFLKFIIGPRLERHLWLFGRNVKKTV